MPIAAVPDYLGQDFSQASPGLRFGLYLSVWEAQGWKKATNNPLKSVTELNQTDQQALAGLRSRQQSDFERLASAADGVRLMARSTAPFTTGLGNEHPTKNGFAFLNPYGLPYLPGSGVKGVLRQATRELAEGKWGETGGWAHEKRYSLTTGEGEHKKPIKDKRNQPVLLSMSDVLFGLESGDGDSVHVRGALSFWDVIPQIARDQLRVEIMTPHYGHYYQGKSDRRDGSSTTPHDSGQPIPLHFLTVPPESQFVFHVVCNTPFLERLAPELAAAAEDGRPHWQHLLESAFQLAFDWLGFGAKTSVGYGAMRALSAGEVAQLEAEKAAQALNCPWVDDSLEELMTAHHMKTEEEALRSKALAENWQRLDDEELKAKALTDIEARWAQQGWWENPPGKAAKKAKAIYESEAGA